ncbi:YhgE/Pip domain-containing protein [Thermoactinomyces sp. DSM 45892]|uniref:YhgE/Pip domain-containing protein n=1 Tax=Thermoactinomyces sp. DSM 45892 TaxID=1882753 RepID=UPI000898818C|nr:YhgE/Pip domain-containing protein [Thermoactinomyces sp. DSM 45892]SDZ36043.1 putative membrane protein [Thermoactinomyces sp. DSM 45892]
MLKRKKAKALLLEYSDFAKIWQIKSMRLAMLGVLALPLVYSFIYLWAFFDPYENVKYLPVAVVNEDVGVHKSDRTVEAGKKIVDKLKDNSKVKWEFVNRKQMEDGFQDGSFALALIIPKDFSEKALTVDSPEPLQGMIEYRSDPSQNYLTSRLGNSVVQTLKTDLGNEITKEFLTEMFAELHKSTDKLQEAADGAQKLTDSIQKAKDGTETMIAKTEVLKDGAQKVAAGNAKLVSNLQQTVKEVEEGLKKLRITEENIKKIQSKVHEYNNLIQNKKSAIDKGERVDLFPLTKGLKEASQLQGKASQNLEELIKKHPDLAKEPSVKSLQDTLHLLQERNTGSQVEASKLDKQLKKLSSASSYEDFAKEFQKLTNSLDAEIANLQKKKEEIPDGLKKAQELADGSAKVAQGVTKLQKEGLGDLSKGLGRIINEGSDRLASELQDGVDKAKESLVADTEKGSVMSDPVHVKENELHKVPNYATGFAPYFLSLSLWVGAMILFTIFDIFQFSSKISYRPVRLGMVSIVGMVQAVITSLALTQGLGIKVELTIWLYVFTMLMGVTFIAINQMLVTYLGNVGRFMAIVILMFQLASSGGTYPIELSPDFIQMIHPFLPMSYTVHGLRAILSNGNEAVVYHDALILLGYFVGAVILTQIGGRYLGKKKAAKQESSMQSLAS